jgi:hypothetical protein
MATRAGSMNGTKPSADISDMASLSGERSEPRTAIMALAKVSWEDTAGITCAASVTIEDTSTYGACIRTKAPIHIGSRLRVDWRGGRFFGVAKYCRSYRDDFIIGIQRERDTAPAPRPALSSAALEIRRPAPAAARTQALEPPAPAAAPRPRLAAAPAAQASTARVATVPVPSHVVDATTINHPGNSSGPENNSASPAPGGAEPPSLRGEKPSMLTKWLHRAPRPEQKDGNGANSNGSHAAKSGEDKPASFAAELRASKQMNRTAPPSGNGTPGALLQLEDIFRAKGIIGLKMGYSIQKVAEMLRSDHVRELPNEMKRASVLMALDVAGISIEDVIEDGERRLEAMNSYEADQEKHLADYEARKVQENAEIQAEMERVTASYLERLKRNMDDVAQLRSPFTAWQEAKQHEAQRMAEAMDLCSKRSDAAAPTAAASAQPVAVAEKISRA